MTRWRPSDHDRARELAAARIDEPLDPGDEAWVADHLDGCEACAAVAADYESDRLLFQGLRASAPEPPRDLWARTAAAIEAADPGRAAPTRGVAGAPRRSTGARAGWLLAPVAGLAVLTVIVGADLLETRPGQTAGPVALATPINVTAADVQVLSRDSEGNFQISTRSVDQVCPIGADSCGIEPSAATAPLAAIAGKPPARDAILSPARDRLIIVQDDNGAQDVYVVPVDVATTALRTAAPDSSAAAGTAPAAASALPAATDAASMQPPSAEPATAEPAATATETAVATTSAAPASSSAPESPSIAATAAAESPSPVAVESAVTASPDGSTAPSDSAGTTTLPKPSPSPSVEVTAGPGGAVRIASDVIVVGTIAAYDATGHRFAFTARPADGSAGPDVYVWSAGRPRAEAVTSDGRSVFAGWQDGNLLVSRVGTTGTPETAIMTPGGERVGKALENVWLPTVSADGASAVWWQGDVEFGRDGVTPVTGAGSLVLGGWPHAGATQPIAKGPLRSWVVRWDPSGTILAVWQGSKPSSGHLSLYRVGSDGSVDLSKPLLPDEPAADTFSLETDHVAWTARANGQSTVKVFAWDGDAVGTVELPAGDGSTIVH